VRRTIASKRTEGAFCFMIKVAICEDDLFYIEKERMLVESYLNKCEIRNEIVTFTSSEELIKTYANSFDIIFLDIEFSGMNGIDAAKWLRDKGTKSYIIFISAYTEYLPEGYKVDAHRYLLKNSDRFDESFNECMESVIAKIQMEETKIDIDVKGGELTVAPSKILYAESNVHKVTLYVLDQSGAIREYYTYDRLDNVQDKLERYGFMRIHQSYLINGDHLRKVYRYKAELTKGVELPISKKYFNDIEAFYIRMRGEL